MYEVTGLSACPLKVIKTRCFFVISTANSRIRKSGRVMSNNSGCGFGLAPPELSKGVLRDIWSNLVFNTNQALFVAVMACSKGTPSEP